MHVLVLGGSGMLGHKLWQVLKDKFDTWVTVRSAYEEYARYELFDRRRLLEGVDVFRFDSVVRAIASVRPSVVVNCIGVVKQLSAAKDPIIAVTVNSLFPHHLADLCRAANARLIHISTDCVFSGRRGMYTEDDVSDAEDLYGRSKFLGEVGAPGCLSIRTSIVGRELKTTNGLVEWFLSNQGGMVQGFTRAVFSGLTTLALSETIAEVIGGHPGLAGVYHVSSEPITKFELLCMLRDAFHLRVDIEPYPAMQIDRSLDSSLFRVEAGFEPAAWEDMVQAMAADPTPYEQWRKWDGF